jgi:hypothetical protein
VQAKELLFLTGALLTQIFHNIGDFISKKKIADLLVVLAFEQLTQSTPQES